MYFYELMFSDPERRKDVMCVGGVSGWPAIIFSSTLARFRARTGSQPEGGRGTLSHGNGP
jgi:hypothetical protein